MKDYIVLDLETPNFRENSICSIGIIVVKNNKSIERIYSLINPEDSFDRINININKIAPYMVKDSPTLPEIWSQIKGLLTSNIIVGHNITYDLRVLSKSLQRYNIKVPDFNFICTLSLSRKNLELSSYSLENIAKNLHIIYTPHNAIEDARATYELFEYINRHKTVPSSLSGHYHYIPKVVEKYDPKLTKNINNLYGMIRVLLFSEYINEAQFKLLEQWQKKNKQYTNYLIFHKINMELVKILEKGYITNYDMKSLIDIVDFVPISSIYSKKTLKTQVLQGIIKAMTADGKVTLEEISYLNSWLMRNNSLFGSYPYDKILNITEKIINEGYITFNQQEDLSCELNDLFNPIKTTNENFLLENKSFCLSGVFKHGNKEEIIQLLEQKGAIARKSISENVDYLFIGDYGSPAWEYGNIGGKIIKAQKLQDNGCKIKIISEKNLFEKL